MIGPDINGYYRIRLADKLAQRAFVPELEPLPVSPWIAMSLLQKAIRRGHAGYAIQAASTLLLGTPDRLWRRCGGIVFEDIGVADLDTVGLVTAALAGKRVRADLGGEWAVASLIVESMVRAPKCRSADDLLMGVELHPALAQERHAFAELCIGELRSIVNSAVSLHERALALWYLVGTDSRARHLRARQGDPALAFDLLCELGAPMTAVELAREGFRRTREPLCLFVGLLTAEPRWNDARCEDDQLDLEADLGAIPSWALDTYTREGRYALSQLLLTSTNAAKWVRQHVLPSRRVGFLGDLLFQIEGGLMKQRLRWPLGTELRRINEVECRGVQPCEAVEALGLLRSDLPELNRIRLEVAKRPLA